MRSKKNNQVKKYQLGGTIALGTGALQAGLGAYQLYEGFKMAKDIKEAPIKKPSEYAEMLKLSRQADLERRRMEEINRSTATAISAAQQAGGRAVVGALPGMIRSADLGTQNLLAQRQALQMGALQRSAIGSEAEIGRGLTREQQQRMAAQAAVEGGIQNIAGALSGVGKAAVLGSFDKKEGAAAPEAQSGMSEEAMAIVSPAQSIERMAGQQAVTKEAQRSKVGKGMFDRASLLKPIIFSSPDAAMNQYYGQEMGDLLSQREALTSAGSQYGITPEQYDALMRAKELGLVNFNDGGKMTKGAFNHKTNPIDIVQAGKKVGEMTGSEVILNPEQQKRLSKESAYFRSLLKKFNKQK
jgi:hypothetical protein